MNSPIYDTIKDMHRKELEKQKNELLDEFERRLKAPFFRQAVKDCFTFITLKRKERLH